jgi:hypothetical protein
MWPARRSGVGASCINSLKTEEKTVTSGDLHSREGRIPNNLEVE